MDGTDDHAWMQSYTGKQLFIFLPEQSEVCIEDIAHALAYICRYGGHSRFHYSVAQHSFLVAELMLRHVSVLKDLPFQVSCDMVKAALLHDAAEYVLGDVVRPLKHSSGMETYRYLEDSWEKRIFQTFRLWHTYQSYKTLIKKFDWMLLATERRDIMSPPPKPWTLREPPMEDTIEEMKPEVAEELFLQRFQSMSY